MRTAAVVLIAAAVLIAGAATATAQESSTTAIVVHGIPGAEVDVLVDGDVALAGLEFGSVTDPFELSPGTHELALLPAGESDADAIVTATAEVEARARSSILAHLDQDGQPQLAVFTDDVSPIPPGDTRLVVRHAAAAPAVDILIDGEPTLNGLVNGEESAIVVPEAVYEAAVAPADSTAPLIGPVDLTLVAGASSIVYAVGSNDDGTLDLLVQSTAGLAAPPAGIPAGTSGLQSDGSFPGWAAGLLGGAIAMAAVAITILLRTRGPA